MIYTAISRRSVSALMLAFVLSAPAIAQGVTGTDPCPKGTACTSGTTTAVTTTKPATTTSTPASTSSSDTSSAMQMLLSLLGLS